MKKILKLVFILSLLTLALVACKKDKQNQPNDAGQTETSQGYNDYQQVLYVNEAKFNISGDMVVLFSDKTRSFSVWKQPDNILRIRIKIKFLIYKHRKSLYDCCYFSALS